MGICQDEGCRYKEQCQSSVFFAKVYFKLTARAICRIMRENDEENCQACAFSLGDIIECVHQEQRRRGFNLYFINEGLNLSSFFIV
jgi:hypothetical protein